MGWFETLPDWLKADIAFERETEALAWCMGKDIRQGKATEKEMLAALYCAGLSAPPDHEHAQIHLFLSTKILTERGMTIPEDIRVDQLTPYEQTILNQDLRALYRRRGKAKTPVSEAITEVFGKIGKKSKANENIPAKEEVIPEECSTPQSSSWMEPLFRKSTQTDFSTC